MITASASDLMSYEPVTIKPATKVRHALDVLRMLEIRHLPVLDDAGRLVGMLSDRDVRSLMVPSYFGGEYVAELSAILDGPASAVMSPTVVSVQADAPVREVIALMLKYRVGAVPVVDPVGSLVGIVSYVDVLRRLSDTDEDAQRSMMQQTA